MCIFGKRRGTGTHNVLVNTVIKLISTLLLSFRFSMIIFVHHFPFKWLTNTLYFIKIDQTSIRLDDFMILNLFMILCPYMKT